MKLYIDKRDLDKLIDIDSGKEELASLCPWGVASEHHPVELTIKHKLLTKYKTSWFKRLRRAFRAFDREMRK